MDGESSQNYGNTIIPEVKPVTTNDNCTGLIVGSLIDVDTDTTTIVTMKPIKPLATSTTITNITTTTNTEPLIPITADSPNIAESSGSTVASQESKQQQDPGSLLTQHDVLDASMKELKIGDKSGPNGPILQVNNKIFFHKYDELQKAYDQIRLDKIELEHQVEGLTKKLESSKADLEREVQRRVDLEQRYTEEAKRTSDQVEELILKADQDDEKYNELKRKFDMYTRETSSMIENFITNRELLASQLVEMRKENDHLLGKYLSKANDLQNAEINLPQTVEELQFYCLTLNEKLILATMAKERLEETMVQNSANTLAITTPAPPTTTATSTT